MHKEQGSKDMNMDGMPIINLSDEEKQSLEDLAESGTELLTHRARLILAYAEGKPTLQAASEAQISRGRARFWKRQFLARRMEIFEAESQDITTEKPDEPLVIAGETLMEGLAKEEEGGATEAEAVIAFITKREKIGIEVTDTIAEAGRKVWSYYFALMLSHEEGTIKGEDIEELHDMRVATRRMRSAFDVFGTGFDPKVMRRYLKGLRKIGRVLGRVRDMDVILEIAMKYQNKMNAGLQPGLNPLTSEWQRTIDQQRVKLTRYLQSEDYHSFIRSFNRFLQTDLSGSIQAAGNEFRNPSVRDSVPALVYSRYAAVRAYESILPITTIEQLHMLRIEFKKFRYTLEYFKEVLGKNIGKAIDEIKQLQDHLGELHDADVGCTLVKGFLAEWEKSQLKLPVIERQNPEPIVTYLAYLHSDRYRLVQTFPELWIEFSRPEFRHMIAEAIALL
jgi:CHAD domain-containing protein